MPYRNLSVITLLAVTFFLGAAQAQFRASLRGTVPRVPALGENANFEVRADVYNFFNKIPLIISQSESLKRRLSSTID